MPSLLVVRLSILFATCFDCKTCLRSRIEPRGEFGKLSIGVDVFFPPCVLRLWSSTWDSQERVEGELGLLESGSGPLRFHIPVFLGCDKLQLDLRHTSKWQKGHFPWNVLDSRQKWMKKRNCGLHRMIWYWKRRGMGIWTLSARICHRISVYPTWCWVSIVFLGNHPSCLKIYRMMTWGGQNELYDASEPTRWDMLFDSPVECISAVHSVCWEGMSMDVSFSFFSPNM